MAKELNLLKSEIAFTELGIQFILPEVLENNMKKLCMFFFILGIDKNVINENHDKLI